MSDVGIQNLGGDASRAPREQKMSLSKQEKTNLRIILGVATVVGVLGMAIVVVGMFTDSELFAPTSHQSQTIAPLSPGHP